MKILALAGLAGSGKDTAAQALIDDGWIHLKFADPIWDCMHALDLEVKYLGCDMRLNGVINKLGRDEAKRQVPYIRRILQRLGTEMGRGVFGEDFWVDHMRARIESLESLAVKNQSGDYVGVQDPRVVISDCRYANEADMVRKLGGRVLLVRRPGTTQMEHLSEALDFDTDGVINNDDDVDYLQDQIREWVR